MANNYHSQNSNVKNKGHGGVKPPSPGKSMSFVEKTAGWGGLPGKSGPNRSNGVKKAKAYVKSEGI